MPTEKIELNAAELRVPLSMRNLIFNLEIDGKATSVMAKQVDRDPIRRDLIHVDFLRVNKERPVTVVVPVNTHGTPVGVKVDGGIFATMKKTVTLRAKIDDIPEQFDLDVSDLPAGKVFYVRDLKFENGVLVTPGKTALFGVTSSKGKEETPAEAAKAAAPAAKAAAPGAKAGAAAPAAAKPAAKPAAKKK